MNKLKYLYRRTLFAIVWIRERRFPARTLYWVGGSGKWNQKKHWSLTKGGEGGAHKPRMHDHVIITASDCERTTINLKNLNLTLGSFTLLGKPDYQDIKPTSTFDYKRLLEKYMAAVIAYEGIPYLSHTDSPLIPDEYRLTPYELEELRRIANDIDI